MSAMLKIGDFVDAVDPWHHRRRELPIPKRWYVLRVQPNREAEVMLRLQRRKISCYLPMVTKSIVATRYRIGYSIEVKREITLPLFPGLIFMPDFACGEDLDGVHGAIGFLRFGPWTAYLDEARTAEAPNVMAMSDVRAIAAIANTPRSKRERAYETGQLVRITDGPFASFSGRIERLDNNGRLSVLINLFGRLSPTLMSEEQIEPVPHATHAGAVHEKLAKLRRIPRPLVGKGPRAA